MNKYSLSILCILSISSLFGYSANLKKENSNPNILFIFADDQRADALGCAGNPYIKTPNIDQLANNGIRFKNTYVMGGHHGAICAPSRAMLMSGKSLFHVYDKLKGVYTMPMYFSKNGYETFGTGKWHNEKESFKESFHKGSSVFIGGMADHYNTPVRELQPNGKLSEPTKKGYSTDIFADAAINYISDYATGEQKQPFFCYVAFTAPHDPRSPREDYIGMYAPETMPLPGNFKKVHPFKFDNLNIRDETLAPWPRTPETIQESIADYYGLISHLDHRVGDIINTLKEKDLFKNTIIVYAADNGLAIGSHGLLGKQNLYEHSTKVPLIISGPNIPKKEVNNAFVYLYDIYPSLAELCNLPVPQKIDGISFTPIIQKKKEKTRNSIYTVYRNTVRAIRTNKWKLIRYPQIGYTQLFNLIQDPLEINNLAYIKTHKNKVDEMMELLMKSYKDTDDNKDINPTTFLPMDYDYTKLKQKPDNKQPPYILNKYFKDVDLTKIKKTSH